jgi:hypothetical protein
MRFFTFLFLLFAFTLGAQDTVYYCVQSEGFSETGGRLWSMRTIDADSLVSFQLELSWEDATVNGYFYHPGFVESPFDGAGLFDESLILSYFPFDLTPWTIPNGERLVQFEFDQDPENLTVDVVEFTKENTFFVAAPAKEQCPIAAPPQEAPLVVSTKDVKASKVKVFPNPARGTVYVQSPERTFVELVSLSGRVLMRKESVKETFFQVVPGFYLVRHKWGVEKIVAR